MTPQPAIEKLPSPRLLFGVVHLRPLPGASRGVASIEDVLGPALADAGALAEGGVDGIVVENFGDAPFYKGDRGDPVPASVPAMMAVVAQKVREATGLPLGINVLRNDGCAALAVAAAAGASYVRVNVLSGAFHTDQGIIEGEAARVAAERRRLGLRVTLLGDLLVKHAMPLAPVDPVTAARDLAERSGADAVIVSGARTGESVDRAFLEEIALAVPGVPVWIGSGLNEENAADLWPHCQGAIVGTSLKVGGIVDAPVDPARVRSLRRVLDRLS